MGLVDSTLGYNNQICSEPFQFGIEIFIYLINEIKFNNLYLHPSHINLQHQIYANKIVRHDIYTQWRHHIVNESADLETFFFYI